MSRGKKQEITCGCGCGRKKLVRVADIKRGWGRFYSKSCKARRQEQRTGQYSNYLHSFKSGEMTDEEYYIASTHPHDPEALGQE